MKTFSLPEDDDDDEGHLKVIHSTALPNDSTPGQPPNLIIKGTLLSACQGEEFEEERLPSLDGLLPSGSVTESSKPAPISPKPNLKKAASSKDGQDDTENNPVRQYITERFTQLDLSR